MLRRNTLPVRCLSFIWMAIIAVGCGPSPSSESHTKGKSPDTPGETTSSEVIVTSEFLRQAGTSLAGERLSVRKIVPDSTTSPKWRPKRADIEAMRSAKLIVMNGAGYEPWKDRVSLPDSRVVDSSEGFRDELIRIPDAVTHQHGPDGKHSHAGFVSALWLDPILAAAQLTELEKSLAALMPDQKKQTTTETARMKATLESLNSELEDIRGLIDPSKMVIASDSAAVSYLTRRLGCKLKYLHWEAPDSPTEENKTELQALTKELPVERAQRVFLLNPRCPDDAESWCVEAGFQVARIDLIEHPAGTGGPNSGDMMERMQQNLTRLRKAIEAASK